jgi:hypothetical protein
MSSEPGNESFFCALRPIPRILSLRRQDYASQVQIGEPSRHKTISACSRAPHANQYGARCRCRQRATSDLNWRKASERSVPVVGKTEVRAQQPCSVERLAPIFHVAALSDFVNLAGFMTQFKKITCLFSTRVEVRLPPQITIDRSGGTVAAGSA